MEKANSDGLYDSLKRGEAGYMANDHTDITQLGFSLPECLDAIVNFGFSLKSDMIRKGEINKVYEAALSALDRVIEFDAAGFAMFDESMLDCSVKYWSPAKKKELLSREMEQMIKDGVFAWVLQHNRWICVPSASGRNRTLLSVLSTRTKTYGMFIAILKKTDIGDAFQKAISIILLICAQSIENITLFEKVNRHSQHLEQMVEKRTRELEKALEKATAANKVKSEFLANISHEFLTPMSGIIGLTELTLQTPLTSVQNDHLCKIKSLSNSLESMIKDLLEFTRIEAGDPEMESTEFHLESLLGDVYHLVLPGAREKGLPLRVKSNGKVPCTLSGNPEYLRKVLICLLNNAVKFTEKGRVQVTVEPVSKPSPSPGWVMLCFSVQDTGIGLTENQIQHLFSPFYQTDGSSTRKYQGIGLSLSICRKLVETMDGEINVASDPGKGSIFTFSVRFNLPPGQRETCRIHLGMEHDHGFLAEDREDSLPLNLPGIDIEIGLEKAGGDKNLFRRLLIQFGEQYADAVDTIKNSIETGDLEEGCYFIVNFIGLCGAIGAMDLYSASKAIEKAFKHSDAGNFQGLVNQFEDAFRIVLDSINSLDAFEVSSAEKAVVSEECVADIEQARSILTQIHSAVMEDDLVDDDLLPSLKKQIGDSFYLEKVENLEKHISEFNYQAAKTILIEFFEALGIQPEM